MPKVSTPIFVHFSLGDIVSSLLSTAHDEAAEQLGSDAHNPDVPFQVAINVCNGVVHGAIVRLERKPASSQAASPTAQSDDQVPAPKLASTPSAIPAPSNNGKCQNNGHCGGY